MGFKVFLVIVLNNGALKTQISLTSQEVSQELCVWFYRPSSVTGGKKNAASNHPLWAEANNNSFGSSVSQAEM